MIGADVTQCRICGTKGSFPSFTAREMMFGSREEFRYFKCTQCGCLQIEAIPADLGRHYPSFYYSQKARGEPAAAAGVKGALVRWYCTSAATRPNVRWARWLRARLPMPTDFAEYGDYLVQARLLSARDRILDVGCGSSPHRLAAFRRCGFEAVEGIDPFIPADCMYHGVPVRRQSIDQQQGPFGLVMFHHSLEHVADPLGTLKTAAALLQAGGTCLVRIPVVDTQLWNTYGVNWAELDAPRHLYLMSPLTMQWMASQAGFKVRDVYYDSHGWEIAASVLIAKDVPMFDLASGHPVSTLAAFAPEAMNRFEQEAQLLNASSQGGRACFLLERA